MRKVLPLALIACFLSLVFTLQGQSDMGIASYYSDSFQGRKTASGEKYDKNKLTAAHKNYPFGTFLKVTRLDNKKSVTVKVNDRGPYIKGRIVDLSRKAAEVLDIIQDGNANVKIEVVSQAEAEATLADTRTGDREGNACCGKTGDRAGRSHYSCGIRCFFRHPHQRTCRREASRRKETFPDR